MNHDASMDTVSRARQGWTAIADLMGVIARPVRLQRQLETVFDRILQLPWLHVQRRGAIMLLNSEDHLVRVAQCGFDPLRARHCEQISLDRCGCGGVARSGEPVFRVCDGSFDGHEGAEAHFILPLHADGRLVGVAPFFVAPDHRPAADETAFMADLAHVLSAIVSHRLMAEMLEVRELDLEEKRAEIIHKLSAASEYRDTETGLHVMRMSHIAGVIAKALGLPGEDREHLVMAAPMHDVGKIGIPDAILLKPGKLDADEFAVMTNHTEIGNKLLDGPDRLMRMAREIAVSHHEKWDGTGYPSRLRGEQIPLVGRICAVADVFDALTSKRPYKEPWPVEKAADLIRNEAGSTFDPKVVAAFDTAMPEILRIRELYRDRVIDPRANLDLPPLDAKPGAWVSWDESVRVGIDTIDEHHRYLFDLTNDLYDAIDQQRGSRQIGRGLRALERYAVVHFSEEERMLNHHGYRDAQRHAGLHRAFRDKIGEFWVEFHRAPLSMGYDVAYFLRDWLVNHIRKEDTKFQELVA